MGNEKLFENNHKSLCGDDHSIVEEEYGAADHLINDQGSEEDMVNEEDITTTDEYFEKDHFRKSQQIKWKNVIILSALHLAFVVCYNYCCYKVMHLYTFIFASMISILSGLGMSAGAHRLYAHRSYKAKRPLQVWLLIFQAMTMNGSSFSYARDHRLHHKHSDTDLDPKNPSRGLFHAHVGWWLLKKTSPLKQAGSKLDVSDLRNDPLVWFQHQYYVPVFLLFGVVLPTVIPIYFWNEEPLLAFSACVVLRITVILHDLFTVNSLAHYFGYRPYDFRIRPTDHRVINYITFGEGNHNFHHVFPWDFRSNERPQWEMFNPLTMFILMNEKFGLVYDKKIASKQLIENTIRRRGVEVTRDQPSKLSFRITNAILDWIFGLLVTLWSLYPALIYHLVTGHPIIRIG